MTAFTKFYCGYSIGDDAYGEVGRICSHYGSRAFLLGGQRALAAGHGKLAQALEGSSVSIADCACYGHECTFAAIADMAERAKAAGAQMVFGMGGGKALDTAKAAADLLGLPLFTFPTTASTCAATTALSVIYREDGCFEAYQRYPGPAVHTFIDTAIIAKAPWIYLQAGMGDTIAKYFESHFKTRGDDLDHSNGLASNISCMCWFPLAEHGRLALEANKRGVSDGHLREAVLANIVSTGLASLFFLAQYNAGVGHSICYGLGALPGFEKQNLHGNAVAYGVLVQLAVDGRLDEARQVQAFMKSLGIKTTLAQMGVSLEPSAIQPAIDAILAQPDLKHIPLEMTAERLYAGMQAVESL